MVWAAGELPCVSFFSFLFASFFHFLLFLLQGVRPSLDEVERAVGRSSLFVKPVFRPLVSLCLPVESFWSVQ